MTRLTNADIAGLEDWREYEARTARILGVDLPGLAAAASGRAARAVRLGLSGRKLAAVSISSGEGLVHGFARTLASIGNHLGMEARAMESPDAEGLAEAAAWGAEYVISADDESFVVRDLAGNTVADNNPATSHAFAAALEFMNGRLAGREVLILGLGIIGRGAAARLMDLGANPLMYDPDWERLEQAAREIGGRILESPGELKAATRSTRLIFDATPAAPALDESLWPAAPVVAAPGVPLAWPLQWMEKKQRGRLWHDPLQSGTAAMLAML